MSISGNSSEKLHSGNVVNMPYSHLFRQGSVMMTHVYPQVVEKFLTKMTNEENKYQDHLAELEGAMNPDAEAVVTQVIF